MIIDELRELTLEELEIKIIELKKDLMDSRFLLATSQIEDTSCLLYTSPSPRD